MNGGRYEAREVSVQGKSIDAMKVDVRDWRAAEPRRSNR
jgi:hypothetical protein